MKTLLPFVFALGTALCWGLYGPTLGKARLVDPDATPFKPYVGIGVAYLIIAIFGGLIAMKVVGKDSFDFTGGVSRWGFAAGVLGALGALSLTLSMFSGGAKIPHAVMPVVFGGAVTISAVYTIIKSGGSLHGGPLLWVGIVGMGISAVLIAANTPHPHPPKPADKTEAVQAAETRVCPMCGEAVLPDALECPSCGEMLPAARGNPSPSRIGDGTAAR
jgi:hypothetical protein